MTLLHGKNFNGAYWEETARHLQKKGFNVLVPDQVGFGKSSKPTDYQYSFAVLASKTKALMKSLTYDIIFTQPVVTEFADLQVPTVLVPGTHEKTDSGSHAL